MSIEKKNFSAYEPDPIKTNEKPVWEMVIDDMKQRDAEGRAKYGTPLQVSNGRNSMTDLYQELLDAVVYTRQEIERQNNAQEKLEKVKNLTDEWSKNLEDTCKRYPSYKNSDAYAVVNLVVSSLNDVLSGKEVVKGPSCEYCQDKGGTPLCLKCKRCFSCDQVVEAFIDHKYDCKVRNICASMVSLNPQILRRFVPMMITDSVRWRDVKSMNYAWMVLQPLVEPSVWATRKHIDNQMDVMNEIKTEECLHNRQTGRSTNIALQVINSILARKSASILVYNQGSGQRLLEKIASFLKQIPETSGMTFSSNKKSIIFAHGLRIDTVDVSTGTTSYQFHDDIFVDNIIWDVMIPARK